jgi:hypothetical protein
MDADDISYPERLGQQVSFLDAHPEIDLLGCQVVIFGEEGQPLAKRCVPLTHAEITANPAANFGIVHPTWLATREWYRKHYYDPRAIRFEDVELLLRSYPTSRFANLPDVLHGYREPRGGFWKRCQSRVGRVRNLKSQREALGRRLYYRAALAEAVKLPSDAALTAFSFRYAMLRAREGRLSAAEVTEWETVYAHLSEPSVPMPVTNARAVVSADK